MQKEKRRRLTDLYARGEEVKVDDGTDNPVVLWIRKMTPADSELAYVKASARRAAFLAMGKEDPPSDAYIALRSQVDDLSKENLVLWMTTTEMVKRSAQVVSRVAHYDEWEKENYLASLQDRAEEEDFQRREEELPEDDEVVRVRKELERFADQVDKETERERKQVEHDMGDLSADELGDMVIQSLLESQADQAWMTEYQKCQIWRCVHDGDSRSERYFQTREEVDELQQETIMLLGEVIERLHVSDREGKDLQQTEASLQVSE